MHDLSRTLVAVATPPGRGGIGCVRLSGPDAAAVARAIFRPAGAVVPATGGAPAFGRFLGADGRPVDHGFLVLFPEGRSFTGEPVAELWAHGSPAVLRALVAAAVAAGAFPAGPGEFTYRALRHGRLDLARAEAIRDLVAARTLHQARLALAQAEGTLSRRIAPLRESLADLIARGEASIEFVEEAEVHLPGGALAKGIEAALREAEALLAGHRAGRIVREGATVAITGAPNVGKSSLFNTLLARERAIVSALPGTTRDTLAETLDLGGIPVTLVDTAGLRDVSDPLEDEGVRRARLARAEADLLLWVLDASRPPAREERETLAGLDAGPDGPRTVIALNKSDLSDAGASALPHPGAVRVSAKTGDGIDALRDALYERLVGADWVDDPVLADVRHAEALRAAVTALTSARAAAGGLSEELVLEDLREAMTRLGEITGEFAPEELYDRIFSTFCIGK